MKVEEKLSVLTTIPTKNINKLKKYLIDIHSNDIVTQMFENKTIFELDTFEGKLYLTLEDDSVTYKFIPSNEFATVVKNTITTKSSKLASDVSVKLKEALINWRKELL